MTRRIVPIVEGHSEAESIPAFLRRLLQEKGIYDVEPDRVVREHRSRLVKPDVFVDRVRMAAQRDGCAAIIAIFDADDDAACTLAPRLVNLAQEVFPNARVVLAVREIESWIIAGIASLRGIHGVPHDIESPSDPEAIRGAKEWLDNRLPNGYKATRDQIRLFCNLDYQSARTASPSLDKFLRDVHSLVRS